MNRLTTAALAFGLLAGLSAFAGDSELDGKPSKSKDAPIVIKHLDTKTGVTTTYEVKSLDENVRTEALEKMTPEEREKAIAAFIKKSAVKANQKEQTTLVKDTVKASELDGDKGTAAHGWRWRGHYGGGFYGGGFYGGYGYGYNRGYVNYAPYWNYGYNLGYANYNNYGGYGGYNNYGGYYGGCGSYGYSNYSVYTAW